MLRRMAPCCTVAPAAANFRSRGVASLSRNGRFMMRNFRADMGGRRANEVTSADGGWRVLFAFVAQWPAAAEFLPRWS